MNPTAIALFSVGAIVLWGGLAVTFFIQIKNEKKNY